MAEPPDDRLLHTPGLQRWVGRGTALLTLTGRRTGQTYPASYARDADGRQRVDDLTRFVSDSVVVEVHLR
ncbi:MAG TPA: hypothetical protein VFZ70_09115 [Euzebyales bacterium]